MSPGGNDTGGAERVITQKGPVEITYSCSALFFTPVI